MEIFCISRICSDKKLTRLQENLQSGFMHKILRVILSILPISDVRESRVEIGDYIIDILGSDGKSDKIS